MASTKNNQSVSFVIPGIDGGLQPINPSIYTHKQRDQLNHLINAPVGITGWALLGKIGIGLIVGALMAVILFVLFMAVGSLMGGSEATVGLGVTTGEHPLAFAINLFLGFVVSFLGNLLLIVIYTFFFSNKYSNVSKTVGILLLTNLILSIGMAVLFLLMKDVSNGPVVVFVLYVCLSLFLSFCQIEFVVNPNYAASSMMGACLGFCISMIVLMGMLAPSLQNNVNMNNSQTLMLMTPLLSFPLMILGQGIWDIIYAKIYEDGSNPFYLPSRSELDTETLLEEQKQELDHEEIPVDF